MYTALPAGKQDTWGSLDDKKNFVISEEITCGFNIDIKGQNVHNKIKKILFGG